MIAAAIGAWLFSVGSLLIAAPPVRVGANAEPASDVWGDVRVTADRVPAAQFTISPDGASIAFFGYHKGYKIYDVISDKVTQDVPCDMSIHDIAFSPDGKTLATAEWYSGIILRDPLSSKVRANLKPDSDLGAFTATYLPDGKLAAYCWRHGPGQVMREQLAVWDPTAKEQIGWPATGRTETDGQMIRRRFVAGGQLLSIETKRLEGYLVYRSVTLTDPATNKVVPTVKLDMDDDHVFDASPDGRTLLVFNLNRQPRLVMSPPGNRV